MKYDSSLFDITSFSMREAFSELRLIKDKFLKRTSREKYCGSSSPIIK
jgi:hypothetical protein